MTHSEILTACTVIHKKYPGNLRFTGVSVFYNTSFINNGYDTQENETYRIYFEIAHGGMMLSVDFSNMGRVADMFPLWPSALVTKWNHKGYLSFTRPRS